MEPCSECSTPTDSMYQDKPNCLTTPCMILAASVPGKVLSGKEAKVLSAAGYSEQIEKETKPQVFNTTVETKRQHWPKFAALIENQFNHGGDKYKLQGFDDREATDLISSVFGGKSEFDWVLGTMTKYIFRFKQFQREKDLLKIATYCYILWLKQGNHMKEEHDQDTKK